MTAKKTSKKRSVHESSTSASSLFDTMSRLDDEDEDAPDTTTTPLPHNNNKTKKKKTLKKKATSSSSSTSKVHTTTAAGVRAQLSLSSKLMEVRILMQRMMQHASALQQHPHRRKRRRLHQDGRSAGDYEEAMKELGTVLQEGQASMLASLSRYTTATIPIPTPASSKTLEAAQENFQACEPLWSHILNKRHVDLRIRAGILTSNPSHSSHSTAFNDDNRNKKTVVDATFWEQVKMGVQHDKLVRASATAENDNHESSKNDNGDHVEEGKNMKMKMKMKMYQDEKLYANLLRDYISSQSTTATHTKKKHKSTLHLSNNSDNNKKEKVVDRKASKGRKIRYVPHEKLVHFTFPVPRREGGLGGKRSLGVGVGSGGGTWDMEEEDWFGSLFGGRTVVE